MEFVQTTKQEMAVKIRKGNIKKQEVSPHLGLLEKMIAYQQETVMNQLAPTKCCSLESLFSMFQGFLECRVFVTLFMPQNNMRRHSILAKSNDIIMLP